MAKVEKALALHDAGANCAESVFSVFAPDFGFDAGTALKIACGLGGGVGRQASVCGAVTGAVLALGLRYGRTDPADSAKKMDTYGKVKEFVEAFTAAKGSIQCKDLMGCDISTPAGMQKANDEKLFKTVCVSCIKEAVKIAELMI
jgi:C_GCAxxG_C_C family probable redox protein